MSELLSNLTGANDGFNQEFDGSQPHTQPI